MAQKVTVELVDDLDGNKAAETVSFALDGKAYEIDLNKKNAEKLRKTLAAYVNSGRRLTASGRPYTKRKVNGTTRHVRDWARQKGIPVSDHGRIPADVQAAYEEAQK